MHAAKSHPVRVLLAIAVLIPMVAGFAPSAGADVTVAEDSLRGRRGLPTMNESANLFELTYAREFTPEHADTLRLYQAFFRREPELTGAKYWMGVVDSGVGTAFIADQFVLSTEFSNTYGALGDEGFIDLVYRNVLGRSADADGRAYWLGQMRSGLSRGGVVYFFASGQEFERLHPYPKPIEPGGPDPELPTIKPGAATLNMAAYGIPNNRTGDPATNTDNFQRAIDDAVENGVGTIRVPAGHYLIGKPGNSIYRAGITLPSQIAFELDDDAIIELAAHDKWNACTIAIRNQTDVIVRGGTLRGDREGHVFTPRSDGATAHDEGHSICVESGSKRILVEDITIEKSTGDGILLVGNRTRGSVTDITVRNAEFDRNRRQGISIVGAIRVDIHDNYIHHTHGTSPQFGIDVESLSFISRDIKIRKNRFSHNAGGDIVNTDGRNVLIEYYDFNEGSGPGHNGRPHRNIDGPVVTWPAADQVIRHNTFFVRTGSVNGKVGIIGYAGRSGRTNNPAPVIIHNNYCDGCGMYWYQTRQVEVTDNTMIDGYLVMRDVAQAQISGNHVTHNSRCWAYRFLRVTGNASGNTYAKTADGTPEPMAIPLDKWAPYNGCWVR